jgi:hypothetical protein
MKIILLAGLAGLAVAAAVGVQPSTVLAFYDQLYPSDPVQRQALDDCVALDPRFNRLDASERAACYRQSRISAAAAPAAAPAGNYVDLWRAAGQGHLRQDDVRAAQQNARYVRPGDGRAP